MSFYIRLTIYEKKKKKKIQKKSKKNLVDLLYNR